MKKAVLAVAALVLLSGLFLVPVFADSISGKPEISDFIVEGKPFKVNDERDITFRFMSNRKPEEVIMRFYSVLPMRTVDNIFSSKKEISVEAVDKNNGTYEIVAIKKVRTPPHPSDVEISVWIEGPDGKSNKLTKRVSFATNPRDVTRTDWRNWTRLPEKIDITPPGPEINEKVASLSGIWQGTFDSSGIFVTVVVTEITSSRVAAIYSSSWEIEPGWIYVSGSVQSNRIDLAWSDRKLTLWPLSGSGTRLEYVGSGRQDNAYLTKRRQ